MFVTESEDPYVEFLTAAATGTAHTPDVQTEAAVQRVLDAVQRSHERREWVERGGEQVALPSGTTSHRVNG